jgi:nucleotide-binding universal stress UspA family protein
MSGSTLRSTSCSTSEALGHSSVRNTGLAGRAGLPLTVYSVIALHTSWFRPEAVQPDASVVPEEVRKAARDALDAVVAGLPGGVRASGELLFGEVVDELSMVADRGVDLLVCGSRGYGPGAAGPTRHGVLGPGPPGAGPDPGGSASRPRLARAHGSP